MGGALPAGIELAATARPPPEYRCGGEEVAPGPSKSSRLRSSKLPFCCCAGAGAAGVEGAEPRRESRSWPRAEGVPLPLEAGLAPESCGVTKELPGDQHGDKC